MSLDTFGNCMKNLQTDNMNGHRDLWVFMLFSAALMGFATSFKMEGRTGGLHIPEKILGVIDMVQSHKNKPVQGAQPTYPPNQPYNYQQYPQQWNGQSNFQNQGFQTQPYQGTYQNQGQSQYTYQNGYSQAGNFPQDGNYANHGNPPSSGQTYTQGQNQQGQYQVAYQNPNQFSQPNNQFQNTQPGYYTGQSQSNSQYQGSSTSFQGQSSQGQGQGGSGHYNQGFMSNGGQTGNGQGPTCVCQVCNKPPEIFADSPATEKSQKKEETST